MSRNYPRLDIETFGRHLITNGGQFCYSVTYYDDNGLGEQEGKVFLSYDPAAGKVTADY